MSQHLKLKYGEAIEESINDISNALEGNYTLSKRSIALLLLQGDYDITRDVKSKEDNNYNKIVMFILKARSLYRKPLNYVISVRRQKKVDEIIHKHVKKPSKERDISNNFISRLTIHPISGILILFAILYFGLYKFVGGFGAGILANFLDNDVFSKYVNPFFNDTLSQYIPWNWFQELFAGNSGIITLGIRYSLAIVLPVAATFFLLFSVIEDMGYLPKAALLIDNIFKKFGLNARAVIPMTLGLGHNNMTNVGSLINKNRKILSTILLSLTIPCSIQLAVMLALLSGSAAAAVLWGGFMLLLFLFAGYLASKLIPVEKSGFSMEVSPLRLPSIRNVLNKTLSRIHWYLREILPIFIIGSVLIFIYNITGLSGQLMELLKPAVNFIGLPDSTVKTFLLGLLSRDYGAANLYDLHKTGVLSPGQLAVAAVTMTLFLPCISQLLINIKELGIKTALRITVFILPFAFLCGYIFSLILSVFQLIS
jgi:ferrous iron transport protein B